jgi:hypothetical protein
MNTWRMQTNFAPWKPGKDTSFVLCRSIALRYVGGWTWELSPVHSTAGPVRSDQLLFLEDVIIKRLGERPLLFCIVPGEHLQQPLLFLRTLFILILEKYFNSIFSNSLLSFLSIRETCLMLYSGIVARNKSRSRLDRGLLFQEMLSCNSGHVD